MLELFNLLQCLLLLHLLEGRNHQVFDPGESINLHLLSFYLVKNSLDHQLSLSLVRDNFPNLFEIVERLFVTLDVLVDPRRVKLVLLELLSELLAFA